MRVRSTFVGITLLATLLTAHALAAGPVEIVTATYLGTGEDDDLQGVAAAPDGTVYVVGNTGAPAAGLPGGVQVVRHGPAMKTVRCGSGFVAHLSGDGRKLLQYAEFPAGVVFLTSVQANAAGVYVGGYGSEGLEEVLKNRPGFMRQYPLAGQLKAGASPLATGGKKDPLAGRPGLGRFGAPCVVKLSADLKTLEAGTYLEGWQQVWDKYRVADINRKIAGGFREYSWQPTAMGLLKGGDVVVAHDGGYGRDVTEADKKLASDPKTVGKFGFYDVCDHLSRLSADLTRRTWHKQVYSPHVDPAVAREVWKDWPFDHYGNPRTHRLRLDQQDHVYICGWSASATSKEPWWAPFLWKVDTADGSVIWKAYDYDPISGKDRRMNGTVADTACVTVTIDDDGNVLSALIADGGNTVMGLSPKADWQKFEGPYKDGVHVKLVHFWGHLHRFDSATRTGLAATRVGPWGWVVDMAALPDKYVLAAGRYNGDQFRFTGDAWAKDSPQENPNAFLRLYGPDFGVVFSTALPGVVPFELTRLSRTRVALVGRAEHGIALTQNALMGKPAGKADGYLMIVDFKEPAEGGAAGTQPAANPK